MGEDTPSKNNGRTHAPAWTTLFLLPMLTIPMHTKLYTTHVPCLVAVVDYTHTQEKIIAYRMLLLLLTVPMYVGQLQPPSQGLGNSCKGKHRQPNSYSLP